MAKGAKKKATKRERRERRYLPQTTHGRSLVYGVGGVGSAILGAGAWASYGYLVVQTSAEGPLPGAPWMLGVGALMTGAAIWLGTSAEPVLHVGDGGVALERGAVRRIAWHQAESVTFDPGVRAVQVRGKDEAGADLTIRASLASQPAAAAVIASEARTRVPKVVELTEGASQAIGLPREDDGESIALGPLQIVGKRCAASNKVIAYEPEAVVCPRCERVYHASEVPAECACGASLANRATS